MRYIVILVLFLVLKASPGWSQMVNIKAVDAPSLHIQNNKMGIGAEIRYGHGIIIDPEGIIVTNTHIIGHAQHIYVRLYNGKKVEAFVLRSGQGDISLLKINVTFPLRAVPLTNVATPGVGNPIVAMTGDAKKTQDGQIVRVFKASLSNDAELVEINIRSKQGDSGGAILNPDGSLLGLIMGRKISDPSKSFCIASPMVLQEYLNYRKSI